MGTGASASIAAAVSPASVDKLREGLQDLSAEDRAKLAVALFGNAEVYKAPAAQDSEETKAIALQHYNKAPATKDVGEASCIAQQNHKDDFSMYQKLEDQNDYFLYQEWKQQEMQAIQPSPDTKTVSVSKPPTSVISLTGAPQEWKQQEMQTIQPSPDTKNVLSGRKPPTSVEEQLTPVSPVDPGSPISPGGSKRKMHRPAALNTKGDQSEQQSVTWKIETEKTGGLAMQRMSAKTGQPLQVVTMRKVEDSVADVVPGPEQKNISGTSNGEFAATIEHDDSGLTDVLAEAIDNLSTDIFQLPFSVSVALPSITDTPLIGISEGFCNLSGYTREEIVGQNCRFLLKGVPQDEVNSEVRQEARRYCRAAHLRNLTSMAHSLLLQRNARKNGELFWNLFMLTLVPGPSKRNYIVGLQLDLGPTLPPAEEARNMESGWFTDHRENLLKVQRMMFGNKPGRALGPAQENGSDTTETYLGLAEDIQKWLLHAEEKCAMFQKWGTLPWVAWPTGSKHALMNGGVCLLRLEAERISKGAVAMSIFPLAKKPGARYFKVRIDEVCHRWGCDMGEGAVLPTLGFTLASPGEVDALGGLPEEVESLSSSFVMLRGDGRVFCRSPDQAPDAEVQQSAQAGLLQSAYKIQKEDSLECTWGKGYIKVEVGNEEIFNVKDPVIFAPPKAPTFALIDCCGAVCRATLMV